MFWEGLMHHAVFTYPTLASTQVSLSVFTVSVCHFQHHICHSIGTAHVIYAL